VNKAKSLRKFANEEPRKDVDAEQTDPCSAMSSEDMSYRVPMARGSGRRPTKADYENELSAFHSEVESTMSTSSTAGTCSKKRPSVAADDELASAGTAGTYADSEEPPRLYVKCKRWRQAARRYLLLRRFWMFQPKTVGGAFNAVEAVGLVEAELELEDQFQAIMDRKKRSISPVSAVKSTSRVEDIDSRDKSGPAEAPPPLPELSASQSTATPLRAKGVEALAPPNFDELAEKELVVKMTATSGRTRNSAIVDSLPEAF